MPGAHATIAVLVVFAAQEASRVEDTPKPAPSSELAALVATATAAETSANDRGRAILAIGGLGEEGAAQLDHWIADRELLLDIRSWSMHARKEFEGVPLETFAPLLQPIAEDDSDPLQDYARSVLIKRRAKAGIRSQRDAYADLIAAKPFDEQVRGWLMRAEVSNDPDRPDPLIQETKRRWRERLAEQPDAALAMQLAGVIEDQLHGSPLGYCSSVVYQPRERSGENFETLATTLRLAQSSSARGDGRFERATRGLAKLELLRGDWAAMNAELAKLDEAPIPESERPWLTPPPMRWVDLAQTWHACDPSMRSGDCAFEVRVAKDGAGVRGAHVLLRERGPEPNVMSTGYRLDTLFADPMPIGWQKDPLRAGFGYEGDDRDRSRYVVTGADGVARFERLPEIEVMIEVLIPTASFAETQSRWDLFVKQPDGSLELDHYRWREGHALHSGETVQGPHLVVVGPHRSFNVTDGQSMAADSVARWTPIDGATTYEVELALGFPPCGLPLLQPDQMPRLRTATARTSATEWPIGADGVGGLRLVPGNVYLLQVSACGAKGELLGRFGRVWCYAPWSHRVATAPLVVDHRFVKTPVYAPLEPELWHSAEIREGPESAVESLPGRIDRVLREQPDAFELEYLRVARAWLCWRDGETAAARAQLAELAAALPSGNVAADTARTLVARIDAHEGAGDRLCFVVADR